MHCRQNHQTWRWKVGPRRWSESDRSRPAAACNLPGDWSCRPPGGVDRACLAAKRNQPDLAIDPATNQSKRPTASKETFNSYLHGGHTRRSVYACPAFNRAGTSMARTATGTTCTSPSMAAGPRTSAYLISHRCINLYVLRARPQPVRGLIPFF